MAHNHETHKNFSNEVAYFAESAYITNDVVRALYALCETPEDKQKLVRLGFVLNEFEEKAGVLTFSERKINFSSIEKSLDFAEEDLGQSLSSQIEEQKKEYLKQVEDKINLKDWIGLAILFPTFGGKLSKSYADTMGNIFEVGKKTASNEMQVASPATDRDIPGVLRAQSIQMEENIAKEIGLTAQAEALYQIQRGADVAFTMAQIEKALDNKIGKMIRASGTQAIMGAFHGGRMSVFDMHKDRIYAFQYTAILDAKTTRFCMSMNGRVVAPNSGDFFYFSPPNHVHCRSFWSEILTDEFIKPAIEDIPDSIPRDRTGMTNFQDLQKIIPYTPKQNITPDEERVQREGVIKQLISDLSAQGVKFKPQNPEK